MPSESNGSAAPGLSSATVVCIAVTVATILLTPSCIKASPELKLTATGGEVEINVNGLASDGNSAQTIPVDPVLLWKRAIDRDDAEVIWDMLPDQDPAIANDKGKTALMSAAKLGDRKLLQALLARGLELRHKSFTGGTILMYAALGNQLEMLLFLLQSEASLDKDAQSTNGWTAIMIAAAKGFDASVRTLVTHGADPSLADAYGWSPLMRAIDNRHSGVVSYLLSLPDVVVDFQNENGSTALHIATVKKDMKSTRLLLMLDARKDIKDNNGMRPSDIARQNGSEALVSLLGAG